MCVECSHVVFSRHIGRPSERPDTVKAYIELAQECLIASQKDSDHKAYAQTALDYLDAGRRLLEVLTQKLDANDTATSKRLKSLRTELDGETESNSMLDARPLA